MSYTINWLAKDHFLLVTHLAPTTVEEIAVSADEINAIFDAASRKISVIADYTGVGMPSVKNMDTNAFQKFGKHPNRGLLIVVGLSPTFAFAMKIGAKVMGNMTILSNKEEAIKFLLEVAKANGDSVELMETPIAGA
jgi:hypothetical protein